MPVKEYYKVDIPQGYRIFEKDFEIAGIHHRKKDFVKAMKKGAMVTFSLKHEPSNKHDQNAVQVRASRKVLFGTIDKHIGYLPSSIACQIHDSKTLQEVKIRPKKLYISDNGYIEFLADLVGPKDKYESYQNV